MELFERKKFFVDIFGVLKIEFFISLFFYWRGLLLVSRKALVNLGSGIPKGRHFLCDNE